MPTKSVLKSKINWIGIALFLIGILSDPRLGDLIPASWLSYITSAAGALTFIIRTFFTNEPVTKAAANR